MRLPFVPFAPFLLTLTAAWMLLGGCELTADLPETPTESPAAPAVTPPANGTPSSATATPTVEATPTTTDEATPRPTQEPQGTVRVGTTAGEMGQRTEVAVELVDLTNVAGIRFDVSFDSAVLKGEGVRVGPPLDAFSYSYRVDNQEGRLSFAAAGSMGTENAGAIAYLAFTALGQGTSPLTLSNVRVIAADGSDITVSLTDGALTVGGGGA